MCTTVYAAGAQCSNKCTYNVYCTCTLHLSAHWQCTMQVRNAVVSILTLHNAGALYTGQCTFNVHCTCAVQLWFHLHCKLQLHREPMSALTLYTARAVFFMHTRCVNAVRFAPTLHFEGANRPASASGSRVEYIARVTSSPERHRCAGKLPNFSIFSEFSRTANAGVAQCCAEKLSISAFFWHS